jgi:hypothetical protein
VRPFRRLLFIFRHHDASRETESASVIWKRDQREEHQLTIHLWRELSSCELRTTSAHFAGHQTTSVSTGYADQTQPTHLSRF